MTGRNKKGGVFFFFFSCKNSSFRNAKADPYVAGELQYSFLSQFKRRQVVISCRRDTWETLFEGLLSYLDAKLA